MNYAQARPLIADGDLIAVRETHGSLTPFTKFFTHSGITHVGVAIWMDGGLWMGELNGGKNHAIPLSQLEGVALDVYNPPVDDRAALRESILAMLRVKIPYAFVALPIIGLLAWLRIKVFVHARRLLVCSGWCVRVYEIAGWPEQTHILAPVELTEKLTLKFKIRP